MILKANFSYFELRQTLSRICRIAQNYNVWTVDLAHFLLRVILDILFVCPAIQKVLHYKLILVSVF